MMGATLCSLETGDDDLGQLGGGAFEIGVLVAFNHHEHGGLRRLVDGFNGGGRKLGAQGADDVTAAEGYDT